MQKEKEGHLHEKERELAYLDEIGGIQASHARYSYMHAKKNIDDLSNSVAPKLHHAVPPRRINDDM